MPELPEVEVVRRGLQDHVAGRVVSRVEVMHPRAIRRHLPGTVDFGGRIAGRELVAARRRGKYLWVDLSSGEAVLAHLGMSGQMLVQPPGTPDEKHLRVRLTFADDGPELRFVDQRTFGGLSVEPVVTVDGVPLPAPIAHIARDPMDPAFDRTAAIAALRRRRTEVKRALLDQTLVSGIGNIYADEALWHARLHWARPTDALTPRKTGELLDAATAVMNAALDVGGTSFDALYVNINGQSGYFDRSLNAYGQEGLPCPRCGRAIQREPFMNRSSFSCPRCQPRPTTS
ncbi:bifunctional DNA-formamidopyrimidine glycosylase/DNA-(apurinic or apyrimidinic site) lyase [Actinokineospora terrae]|uniref:bifunctional DNA-formamidopyrimidine glycosylase/DNA-(apurinic or apyrimidinic site) lyase n=1 Tax=Actinokineospora terrae TaxID=155974 RepID=UPI000B21D743|nr:bifunctional DNA-formamidopyrimidine glycosylase/DNA-(apurinic or apyrimidinic site) lyase [Actinokineospora terrae]